MTEAVMDSRAKEPLEVQRERFSRVLAGAKTVPLLTGLFDKLHNSALFSEAAKDHAFGVLLAATCKKVPDRSLVKLVELVGKYRVASRIRAGYDADTADQLLGDLVGRALGSATRTAKGLKPVFEAFEAAGVSQDRGQALSLACVSSLPVEGLDEICDLTYEAPPHADEIKF